MKSFLTAALLSLLASQVSCQSSPYDGPSRVPSDSGETVEGEMPAIMDDDNDDNQDPNIGEPM